MELADLLAALALGFAAGVTGGLLGIGGGIIFVPALVIFLEQTQREAVATSLVAIIPLAIVGAVRQHRAGNLALRDGLTVGALSPLGVLAGTALANALPERALELGFAGLQLVFAYRLGQLALRASPGEAERTGRLTAEANSASAARGLRLSREENHDDDDDQESDDSDADRTDLHGFPPS